MGTEFSIVGAFLTTARPDYSLHSIMLGDPEVKSQEVSRLLACDGVGGSLHERQLWTFSVSYNDVVPGT